MSWRTSWGEAMKQRAERNITAKEKAEERILRFSFLCSALFTITEVVMALLLHSYSVMMDGVYDCADLILLGPFLVLVPLLYKPVTEKHPYGYSQLESLFLIFKYGILLAVTVTMIVENVRVILSGGHTVNYSGVALYEMAIGLLCIAVYVFLRVESRRYTSPTIQSELYLWKQDIVSSMGVSLAFLSQAVLKHTPLSGIIPYIDSSVALVMAVVLIREPIASIGSGFRNLVLFAPDEETMAMIRDAVDRAMETYPYTCSFLDVIKTGRKVWVEIYVTPDKVTSTIDVRHWASIRSKIQEALRPEFDQLYVELIPDIPDSGQ
ncbi:MAG: cation transporter [Lachnospiraceae bacterium]|nr:cation transporter [Lachnospiraceae bacterium]